MNERYKGIITLPHHTSEKRRRMSQRDRAAQFAPYSALNGYEESIAEEGRLTERECELDEYEIEKLDRILSEIKNEKRLVRIAVTYFIPDPSKPGGRYVTRTGYAEHIDEYKKSLRLSECGDIDMQKIAEIRVL